ncbi:2Fe-2S iron-sulfur cluster-binding protein [Acinetobacter courvalinii]|uniref:Oxidoreductase n=1 Tax=Acinetobacter courvalinii TaxID=280147 RepID=N9RHI3_9GAMM|nr:2Fe-2S iron-sulfur cluster binding domain-containing protein [Acinetobacter courvalinii]ENX38607.1 hypothetical protein F888_01476 [Acinetobacter courvalinii]KAB0657579.1 2Fe-2S iron-sulfur cluster binding domain-containing protein [Acinetobacter courvalinii]RSN82912.1 oxidoreductase [Acinetobacter baumannii]GGH35205.1 oxidoreductase [Acinetobacter courvalinii]
MTFKITLAEDHYFHCGQNDVILRAGLRHGFGMPYECNTGGCGTCKIEVVAGEIENLWPEAPGLTDRDRRKGRVLACQSRPKSACKIKVHLDEQCKPNIQPKQHRVQLIKVTPVTHDIVEIHLQSQQAADFLPGQYALLQINGELQRAYSMANLPNKEGRWVFQIKRVVGGQVTGLLFDELQRQQLAIVLDGPYGLAHLQPEESSVRPIICIAGGSGLAPMLSIARGAAQQARTQQQKLYFFHGGREARDLLNHSILNAWTGLGEQLVYVPATSFTAIAGISHGFIHEVVQQHLGQSIADYEVYCAGPPPMVQSIEQMAHAMGLPRKYIHFDRFF